MVVLALVIIAAIPEYVLRFTSDNTGRADLWLAGVRMMADYPGDTAGRIMDPRVSHFKPGTTVREVLAREEAANGEGSPLARAALRGHHYRNARLVGDVEELRGSRVVERDVHAEGLLRSFFDVMENGLEVIRPHRPGRQHPHAAGVRHRDDQRGVGRRPAHRRLEDRVLDAEQLGDPGLHFASSRISSRAWPASLARARSRIWRSLFDRQPLKAASRSAAAPISPS